MPSPASSPAWEPFSTTKPRPCELQNQPSRRRPAHPRLTVTIDPAPAATAPVRAPGAHHLVRFGGHPRPRREHGLLRARPKASRDMTSAHWSEAVPVIPLLSGGLSLSLLEELRD